MTYKRYIVNTGRRKHTLSRPKSTVSRKITTMRLPERLLEEVAAVGRAEGRTRANMTEKLLTEGVKNRKKKLDAGVLG